MKMSSKIYIYIVLLISWMLSGCSFFQTSANKTEDSAFYSSATATTNPNPVPAEIATDIAEIMKGNKRKYSSIDASSELKAQTVRSPANLSPSSQDSEVKPLKPQPIKSAKRRRPSGISEKYTVKNGDTLMKISFEKFGNVYRWREIYADNKNLITDFNRLTAGTVLTIAGVDYVVVLKNGKPYLIRRNDTLVKISSTLYGTPMGWKGLWANNPQLIHDPNKIYAGFTLYYLPFDELPTHAPSLASYSNERQLQKLRYIQSLRKPATTK